MMKMRMREQADGTIFYAIRNGYRIVYGLFCLLIGLGFMTAALGDGFSGTAVIPIILFLVSFAGLGYRESWKFDPHAKTIEYKVGFLFWVKSTQYSIEDVQSVNVSHFVRGRSPANREAKPLGRNKALMVFSLHLKDDSVKDIEIIPERTSGGRTEAAALRIATAMGLTYHADRATDTIQAVSVHDV